MTTITYYFDKNGPETAETFTFETTQEYNAKMQELELRKGEEGGLNIDVVPAK